MYSLSIFAFHFFSARYGLAPSLEFSVRVVAHSSGNTLRYPVDTWVYQLRGSCTVAAASASNGADSAKNDDEEADLEKFVIREGACMTIPAFTAFRHISGEETVVQDDSSTPKIALSLVVQQHPQVAATVATSFELKGREFNGTSTSTAAVSQNNPGRDLDCKVQAHIDVTATSAADLQVRI